jgi:tetratricopeptide (TPR) repeat protein
MMTKRISALAALCLCAQVAAATAQQGTRTEQFEALLGLARVKRDAGDPGASRRYFEDASRVRALDPAQLAEFFWVLADQDAPRAIAVARDVLRATPSNDRVRERALVIAAAVGDEDTVVALASVGRRLAPKDVRWPRHLAESAARRDAHAEAAEAYAAAIPLMGSTVSDRVGLALAREASGDPTGALAAWNGVPASARDEQREWAISRLRVLAASVGPDAARPDFDAWFAAHPDDFEPRAMLVDLFDRAGRPADALAALGPLTSGPYAGAWQRREAQLARAAGDRDHALAVLDRRTSHNRAKPDERLTFGELLIETSQFERAKSVVAPLAFAADTCDDTTWGLLDRLPDTLAVDVMFLNAKQHARACEATPRWMLRTVERLVAVARHDDALAIIDLLPIATREIGDVRRLNGQLNLWTGHSSRAAQLLEPLVEAAPTDRVAREALADAYRAEGKSYAAWAIAESLVAAAGTDDARLKKLAEIALEADAASAVEPMLAAIQDQPAVTLRARALLSLGRPAEAHRLLAAIDPDLLTAGAALALVDSTIAVEGNDAALTLARCLPTTAASSPDLATRIAMLEALSGDTARAKEMRTSIAQKDRTRGLILDVETALSLERPSEAVSLLRQLPDAEKQSRTADLLSTALAGVGELSGANVLVSQLIAERPRFANFIIRQKELAWRLTPSAETLAAVLALPAALEGNHYAAIAAARALESADRYAEALAQLDAAGPRRDLPVEGKMIAARSLRALGYLPEALAALDEQVGASGPAGILRAEIVAAVKGWLEAAKAFQAIALRPVSTPSLYLAWAAAAPVAAERVPVLREANTRFSGNPEILARLAAAEWQVGEREAALRNADQSLVIRPGGTDAWVVYIDATAATRSRAELDAALSRFAKETRGDAALAAGMAEHLAGLARGPEDPLLEVSLKWLNNAPAIPELAFSQTLARARVLAVAENYTAALSAIDDVLAQDGTHRQALRLRADVLSYAGQHAEALAAYDTYVAIAPEDIDARRQQARVAGWAGRSGEARTRYRALIEAFPANAVVAAEAGAKDAFFSGRWHDAVGAYERWLALEPDNAEAQFELAEAHRALGNVSRANSGLAVLESRAAGHRLATAAHQRARVNARPSVTAVFDSRSADGYEGQRLLDLREQGAIVTGAWGLDDDTALAIEGVRVEASGADAERRGYRAGANITQRLASNVGVSGTVALWDLGSTTQRVHESIAQVSWRADDRWTLAGGFARQPLQESLASVDRGLTTSGPFATLRFDAPLTSIDVHATRQDLSDGNARSRTTMSASQALGERLRGLRLIAWVEQLSYRSAAADYFTPSSFLHVDAGLEYAYAFSRPRFRGDRDNSVAVSYLFGTDSRGTRYLHPSVRLSLEVVDGLALDARAGWIRSADYDETTFMVALRVGGLKPLR